MRVVFEGELDEIVRDAVEFLQAVSGTSAVDGKRPEERLKAAVKDVRERTNDKVWGLWYAIVSLNDVVNLSDVAVWATQVDDSVLREADIETLKSWRRSLGKVVKRAAQRHDVRPADLLWTTRFNGRSAYMVTDPVVSDSVLALGRHWDEDKAKKL